MPEVADRVIRVFAETQQIDPARLTLDSTFDDLGIDSFDGVNLLYGIETEFGISVSDDEAKQLRSVRDVVEGVEALLARKTESGS